MQTPGAPLLRIVLTSTNTVLVAWPAPATGFSLQQSDALSAPAWVNVTNSPVVVGAENQVIITPSPRNRFYRLKYP